MNQRLELTWIGKDREVNLEPRMLIEDNDKSYGDKNSKNMLIHGDNLLALKALESEYTGKIKCVYIDPPYNTGNAFEHYDDFQEHNIWLNLMYTRLQIIHRLISSDGFLFLQLDSNEVHYCKIILDEIFGRDNFVNQISYERSAVSGIGQGASIVSTGEYILIYKKSNSQLNEVNSYVDLDLKTMKRYNKVMELEGERVLLDEFISKSNGEKVKVFKHENFKISSISFKGYDANKGKIDKEYCSNYSKLFRTFLIQKENSFQQDIIKDMSKDTLYSIEYIPSRGKNKDKLTNLYYYNRELVGWLKDSAEYENGKIKKSSKLTNIWTHDQLPKADLPNEGGISFPRSKKPEQLIKRILELSTNENDIVLDSFLGSGTTAAVAHKMNRRWIGIELGEHCYTHCITRLKNVIDGTDNSGISKTINWQGGGGFKFYELASSLLNKDAFGNWVINKEYNAAMLSNALCKIQGFKYQPNQEVYWKQGFSNEFDYIYVTTNFITVEHIDKIYSEMKENESLLICCKSYQKECEDKYANIDIKKIPQSILNKCEFGNDSYNLIDC